MTCFTFSAKDLGIEYSKEVIATLCILAPQNTLDSIHKIDSITAKTLLHHTKYLQDVYPFMSKSHSCGYAAILYSHIKMGVDLEMMKLRSISAHLDLCCNPYEIDYILKNPLENFYKVWTLKEAILKLQDLQLDSIKNVGLNQKGAFGVSNTLICFKHLPLKQNLMLTMAWY